MSLDKVGKEMNEVRDFNFQGQELYEDLKT